MKMQIILLYAAPYRIEDAKTGEINEGVTCNYYFNTDLHAIDNKDGSKGTRPAKGAMDVSVFSKIKDAPALYEAELEMRVGSDGKPVLKIVDVDYISSMNFAQVG